MNKFLGQHFLRNQNAIRKTIEALALESGETVIEIGPGHGELTDKLNSADKKINIIAIEKDPQLFLQLEEKFKAEKNIKIIQGDALKILKSLPESLAPNSHSYKIVGNIPYYITGKLFRTISELEKKPERSVFMIQKEVAERIVAGPPDMNRLAASIQFWANLKILMSVPREDFNPPPKVDSAIIVLETKNEIPIDSDHYYKTIRILFAQPRKTILNNLAVMLPKADLEKKLAQIGVDPNARPQNLGIQNITDIASF